MPAGSPAAPAAPDSPRVLVVRFSSIGDILLVTPLLRVLRRRHPHADVTFVTKEEFASLVSDNPHLTRIEVLGRGEPLASLAARLRRLRPTHGLDVHGSLRTLALRFLVPSPCRWRGYNKRRLARTVLIASKRNLYGRHVPTAERYFEAARDLAVEPDGGPPEFFLNVEARRRVTAWLAERNVAQRRGLVALAPGAAHFTKRWPAERWEVLAARLARRFDLLFVGGPSDVALVEAIRAGVPGAASAAGSFGLQETGAALATARAVVSGDTGVMHMATGVRTPVVALFGPTVEAFGFFPYRSRAEVIQRDLDCRPCSAMGTPACPLGHHRCLRDTSPDEVEAAVLRLVP